MKMEPDKKYKIEYPPEITVNADELKRIEGELDDLAARYIELYRRVHNLYKQGTLRRRKRTAQEDNSQAGL